MDKLEKPVVKPPPPKEVIFKINKVKDADKVIDLEAPPPNLNEEWIRSQGFKSIQTRVKIKNSTSIDGASQYMKYQKFFIKEIEESNPLSEIPQEVDVNDPLMIQKLKDHY